MKKVLAKILILILIFILLFLEPVQAITNISDRISLSWPGTGVNHTIKFLTTCDIPPGGTIEITPEDGQFFIYGGFDYTDVDLATSSSDNGPFVDRDIAASVSSTTDTVVSIASTTSGSVTIVLNSNYGITTDTYVEIELGTNALYGDIGDRQIVNSNTAGSYNINIRIYDATYKLLKKARPMIAIIEPVTVSGTGIKRRLYGAPIGWLTYGTTQTILSIVTNYDARCRYAIASGTSFADMTEEFNYGTAITSKYHTKTISGLTNGSHYEYFVRCRDEEGNFDEYTDCVYVASTSPYTTASGTPITSLSCLDYWIPFAVSGQAGTDGGDDTGAAEDVSDNDDGSDDSSGSSSGGGGSSGGSGGGSGGSRGRTISHYLPYPAPPGEPGVVFRGWAYPGADVAILQDGQEVGFAQANNIAEFGAFLEDLNQGVYTFTLWAEDEMLRRSSNYSTTFWIDDGTQTTVADIIIPPTIAISAESVNVGENIEVFGFSVPGGTIETWHYFKQEGEVNETSVIKKEGLVDETGKWSMYLETSALSNGDYYIKARTKMDEPLMSGFSQVVEFNVGGAVENVEGVCEGADLNQDGRVNITDFSILLFHWGTNDACADQNKNGLVELIDFSIMLYYWTG